MDKVKNILFKILFWAPEETNVGYFILRLFTGLAFTYHGYQKLFVMPTGAFTEISKSAGMSEASILPPFVGLVEFSGGLLLLVGLLTRISAFGLFIIMLTGILTVHSGQPFAKRELPMVYMFIMLMFMLKGAGDFSIDNMLSQKFLNEKK